MIHDLGKEFIGREHQVSVIAPSDRIKDELDVTVEDGLQVLRVRVRNIKYAFRAVRGWRESRLSALVWSRAKSFLVSDHFDLIVCYSPTIFFAQLMKRLKAMWNCPAYLVQRDVFPKWAVDAKIIRSGGIIHRYFSSIESLLYDTSDVIGIETPGNLRYFRKEFPEKMDQVEVLLNWTEIRNPPHVNSIHRSALGMDGKVVFFYGGNIGVAQDMDNLIRLAWNLRGRNDIAFLLVGSGSEVSRLQVGIKTHGLTNITILPGVPQNEYLQMLAEFDVGLVSLDRRLQTNSLTGKLLGYMTCGMPVLASLNSGNDLQIFLQDANAGFALENGDDDGLLEAALRLADSPELRKRMGANSRRLLEDKFSVQSAAMQILGHFLLEPLDTKNTCANLPAS